MNIDIKTGIDTYLKTKMKKYQCHTNRISSIGHPCKRYLYYCRTAWDKSADTELSLQGIFETGNILERQIEKILIDIGTEATPRFRVIGSQLATNDDLLKKYNISGTIDGFLQVEEKTVSLVGTDTKGNEVKQYQHVFKTLGVIDIKTSNPNIFARLDDIERLKQYSWTQKYIAQLMMYAFAHNLEDCFILFVNKTNLYDMKIIHFKVDFQYVEELLQKAEEVNLAVECEEAPDKINVPRECSRCSFASLCCPELVTGGDLKMCESVETVEAVERMQEIAPIKKEFDALDRQLKGLLVKGQNLIIGDWLLEWSSSERKESTRKIEASTIWRKKFMPIKDESEE